MDNASATPSQIRDRREASRRCQKLPDGRRDPLDKPPVTRNIQVRGLGSNTVEFTNCDRAIAGMARYLGIRIMRSRRGGAWQAREADAHDLIALAELRGYHLDVVL